MAKRTSTKRTSTKRSFNGMSYRDVQRANSNNRRKLHREDQKWLKAHQFKNAGWDNVVSLYEKINEFLAQYQLAGLSLEDLFLEADRIGNKYLTAEEIADFNQKLAQEVEQISEQIDQQFPDTEIEIIDFRATGKPPKRGSSKSSKPIKF